MFVVYLPAAKGKSEAWLRSTILTMSEDRAQRFADADAALAAIAGAAMFHKKSTIKALCVVHLEGVA